MRHASSTLIATLLLTAPIGAGAQGLGAAAAATIPQYVSFKIGSGATAKTVTQLTVPFMAAVPISSRLNIDVATAFATSEVSSSGASVSSISGITDTQVRANLTLGTDAVVFTVGANLPTGQYKITQDKSEAAGQIGNDFLMFPTSSYGAGLSTTGGIAVARSLGNWNFGIAGSFRKSTEFNAYEVQDNAGNETLTFTPADEVRARIGADRSVGSGRLTLGVTFSTFGDDMLANTSYATGDRYIGQASLFMPVGNTDVFLSGWGLYRAKGQQFGGEAAPENVLNGALSLGFRSGNLYIEPNVEVRNWQVDGAQAGFLGNGGLRVRWTAGAFSFIPTFTYQLGQLNTLGGGDTIDLSGWRASVTLRIH